MNEFTWIYKGNFPLESFAFSSKLLRPYQLEFMHSPWAKINEMKYCLIFGGKSTRSSNNNNHDDNQLVRLKMFC